MSKRAGNTGEGEEKSFRTCMSSPSAFKRFLCRAALFGGFEMTFYFDKVNL